MKFPSRLYIIWQWFGGLYPVYCKKCGEWQCWTQVKGRTGTCPQCYMRAEAMRRGRA